MQLTSASLVEFVAAVIRVVIKWLQVVPCNQNNSLYYMRRTCLSRLEKNGNLFSVNLRLFQGGRLRNRVKTDAQVHAFDQDLGINTPLRYSIIHGKSDFESFDLITSVREYEMSTLLRTLFSFKVSQIDNFTMSI